MNIDESSLSADPGWKALYKVGAMAAIIMVVLIPTQGIIFALWPPPKTVLDWFLLFQKNKFIGLLDMDLLLIVDYVLLLIVFLALWAALRRTNQSLTAIALLFQLVSITTYFASTAAFEMLNLSNHYAAATTDVEKTIFLASGQTMFSIWQGTAFNVSYLLGCIALIIVSIVMLQSNIFSKATSYLGLAAGILMTIPPTVGIAGIIISFISLVPAIPWLILIAGRFIKLGQMESS